MRRSSRACTFLLFVLTPQAVLAYQPFDNTDADTARYGVVELEVRPAGFTRSEGQTTWSPLFIFNYGFLPGYEAVFEVQDQLALGPLAAGPRESVGSLELTVKHVLREGVLQDAQGPSVALEVGALLPGIQRESGVGAIATFIVSQRFGLATLHFNANLGLQHDGNLWVEPALIAEGPGSWAVRPVTELLYSHEFGGPDEASALLGGIWQIRESLSIDFGARAGRAGGAPLYELRGGFTISY